MSADETPDELRARLGALAVGGHPMASRGHMRFAVALVNAWPTIDALLARLAVVEEENDELHEDLVRMMQERNAAIARLTATEADADRWERAYRFLALRERPQ